MARHTNLRAIDLYAGVGGWKLGLALAGIEVVESFEWWPPAVATTNANHGTSLEPVNIRKMELSRLPSDIDVVVGSPPCTEFSYSNRGGGGDLDEGLIDLVRFFEIVDHVAPRFWAMENVPRVAEVLRKGFSTAGHPLHRFIHLRPQVDVFDMAEFGVPQARRRCIAGNFSFSSLRSYMPLVRQRTLGDIVSALADEVVVDPLWGVSMPKHDVTEMETEPPLNAEELRMNREAKLYHPVYNNMSFPDELRRPARTVTATCTRVSRESIVIAAPSQPGEYRRLSIRERACLQGFPITYQFFGQSFSEKAKMIGNAIPPPVTFLVAHSILGTRPGKLLPFESQSQKLALPAQRPIVTRPDREGRTYPPTRRFMAAIPKLRFKSGMRFDFANGFRGGRAEWEVRFFFGPSKDIRQVLLDRDLLTALLQIPGLASVLNGKGSEFTSAALRFDQLSGQGLQNVWTHRSLGIGPYELVDSIGELAETVHRHFQMSGLDVVQAGDLVSMIASEDGEFRAVPGERKLRQHALRVLSGFVVGSWFNSLRQEVETRQAA